MKKEFKCKYCKIAFCRRVFKRKGITYKYNYCSVKCARKDLNVGEHQRVAGKAGGLVRADKFRGTGKRGYIKWFKGHQHRFVMEWILGRRLLSNEIVHHIDEDKHNNHPDNLEILTRAEHTLIHLGEYWRKKKHAS